MEDKWITRTVLGSALVTGAKTDTLYVRLVTGSAQLFGGLAATLETQTVTGSGIASYEPIVQKVIRRVAF